MAELVDPTQKGNYPVVLGDSLLRKNSNEIFTGVRYNHKPPIATAEQNSARLKPSVPGRTTSYDLNFLGEGGRTDHAYAGARNTEDGQYVLYFDAEREVFVLDRIDSTFNMNITRTPNNSDPEALRKKYPQIDRNGRNEQSSEAAAESSKKSESQSKAGARTKEAPARKTETKKAESKTKPKPTPKPKPKSKAAPTSAPAPKNKGLGLVLPQKGPAKPKPKPRTLEEEEDDEEENDDFGLSIEYPGVDPRAQKRDFSPAAFSAVAFEDYMDQRDSEARESETHESVARDSADPESEAEDADGESEDEMDTDLKAPDASNYNNRPHGGYSGDAMEEGIDSPPSAVEDDEEEEEEVEMEDVQNEQPQYEIASMEDDLENDLEKDLEKAFEDEKSESEISEED